LAATRAAKPKTISFMLGNTNRVIRAEANKSQRNEPAGKSKELNSK
jgi:hypothetical protein